jgi:hypothetical protein
MFRKVLMASDIYSTVHFRAYGPTPKYNGRAQNLIASVPLKCSYNFSLLKLL